MDQNAVAYLFDDVHTVTVVFPANRPDEAHYPKEYAYLSLKPYEPGTKLIVLVNELPKIVTVTACRTGLAPDHPVKLKWIAGEVDLTAYETHMAAVAKLEDAFQAVYQKRAQQRMREVIFQDLGITSAQDLLQLTAKS